MTGMTSKDVDTTTSTEPATQTHTLLQQAPEDDSILDNLLVDGPAPSTDGEFLSDAAQGEGQDTAGATPPKSDPANPDASDTQAAGPPDKYLKQLSQQVGTLSRQLAEATERMARIDSGKAQAATDQPPAGEADTQQQLAAVADDLADLEKALENRGEYEGVEPKDLKQAIKAMRGLGERLNSIEQEAKAAKDAVQQVSQKDAAAQFFQAESQKYGVDAEKLWGQASSEAVKYHGQHEKGTPQYEMARTFATARYNELIEQNRQRLATPGTRTPAQQGRGPGNQPRQAPRGTTIKPAGARPAGSLQPRSEDDLINGLITDD